MKLSRLSRLARRLRSPDSWSTRMRRGFVLLFPIALPLWLAAWAVLGLVVFARGFIVPVYDFWTAPPRRRYRSYYYPVR